MPDPFVPRRWICREHVEWSADTSYQAFRHARSHHGNRSDSLVYNKDGWPKNNPLAAKWYAIRRPRPTTR